MFVRCFLSGDSDSHPSAEIIGGDIHQLEPNKMAGRWAEHFHILILLTGWPGAGRKWRKGWTPRWRSSWPPPSSPSSCCSSPGQYISCSTYNLQYSAFSTVHAVQCLFFTWTVSANLSPAHNLSPLSGAQSIFHIWCRECSQQSLENMATFVNLSSFLN